MQPIDYILTHMPFFLIYKISIYIRFLRRATQLTISRRLRWCYSFFMQFSLNERHTVTI